MLYGFISVCDGFGGSVREMLRSSFRKPRVARLKGAGRGFLCFGGLLPYCPDVQAPGAVFEKHIDVDTSDKLHCDSVDTCIYM